ncbi:hypothetical protein [Holdemania filiformis]|uniref:hypothetical protein n=1 Tax=Holdemania filiformis TaxID=61171 RepID=UPI00210B6867|nr:hypothetical protein [Holdemania filiformis]MCQ4952143.1 hypothetical protein [Holdemania filiformis]
MNKERRKSLREIQSKLDRLGQDLETLKEEEEEYRDNMPENLQESDRYQRADEVCDLLQEVLESMDNAYQQIEEAVEC